MVMVLDTQFLVASTMQTITKEHRLVKKAEANIKVFRLDGIVLEREESFPKL